MRARAGNGTIEFNEFLLMMTPKAGGGKASPVQRRAFSEAEYRQAFGVFDLDGDGLIDANELRLAMRNLGVELSDKDVRSMLLVADKNKDGKIDFTGSLARIVVAFLSFFIFYACILKAFRR